MYIFHFESYFHYTFYHSYLTIVGDLAYDIAFHLHQMAYTDEDEDYFMNQLKKQYTGDFESLYRDIKLYKTMY